MQIRQPRPINEFKVIDGQGNEYPLVEYRKGTETRSLKWLTAGQSWFALADGTAVDKIDDETFRIATSDTVLRRTGQRASPPAAVYGRS
jgi:hypothetical protein